MRLFLFYLAAVAAATLIGATLLGNALDHQMRQYDNAVCELDASHPFCK